MKREPMGPVYERLWLESEHSRYVCTTHDGSALCKCPLAARLNSLPILSEAENRRYRTEKKYSTRAMSGIWWRKEP